MKLNNLLRVLFQPAQTVGAILVGDGLDRVFNDMADMSKHNKRDKFENFRNLIYD
jgi:hypothetical protein